MTLLALTRAPSVVVPVADPANRALRSLYATLAVGVGATILVSAAAWGNRGFVFDDPGIFWRYAQHLATGAGWDYNAGQAGTASAITSPLYVLVLALGAVVAGAGTLPAITTVLFVACLAGAATVTFAGLRVVGHPIAGVLAAILLCTSPLLLITRGMESSLYLLLASSALLAFVTDHHRVSGAALGALILTRPDGVLLALSLGVYVMVRYRRWPVALAASAGAVVLPWLVYSQVRFGTIFPSTLLAKVEQGRSGLWGSHFLLGLLTAPAGYALGWSLVVALPLAGGLIVLVRKRDLYRWTVPLFGYTGAYVIGYSVLRVPAYEWYYALPTFTVIVVAAIGLESILASRRIVTMLIGCLLSAEIAVLGVSDTPGGLPPVRARYQTVGLWLKDNTAPNASVASEEIGLIGYYSHRTMIDYSGLFSASDARDVGRGDFVSWVGQDQPDYVVLELPLNGINAHLEAFALQSWFPSDFHQVSRSGDLVIYQRTARAP